MANITLDNQELMQRYDGIYQLAMEAQQYSTAKAALDIIAKLMQQEQQIKEQPKALSKPKNLTKREMQHMIDIITKEMQ